MTENVENTDQAAQPRWKRILLLTAAAGAVVAVLIVALMQFTGGASGDADASPAPSASASPSPTSDTTGTPAPTDTPTEEGDDVPGINSSSTPLLPETMNGQAAIDALGDNIAVVAERSGKTVEQLTELLLRDKTAHVSTNGYLLYLDDFGGGNGTRP